MYLVHCANIDLMPRYLNASFRHPAMSVERQFGNTPLLGDEYRRRISSLIHFPIGPLLYCFIGPLIHLFID